MIILYNNGEHLWFVARFEHVGSRNFGAAIADCFKPFRLGVSE